MNRRQRPEKLLSACRVARLMAEWPSVEPSDGTCAKHLRFLIEPIEEIAAPIALVGREDTSARRLCQPAGGDLVSSIPRK
jgi:hypothetical protein